MTEVRAGGTVRDVGADALIVPLFAGDVGLTGDAAAVNDALDGVLASVIEGRGWKASVGSTIAVPAGARGMARAPGMQATTGAVGQTADLGGGIPAREVILAGLGRQEAYGGHTARRCGRRVRRARARSRRSYPR